MELINGLVKEMAVIYARIISEYKFKYQCVLLCNFDKQGEFGEILEETELFINLKINHNLTETDLNKINIKWDLERQIQQQEIKRFGLEI